MLKGLSVSIKRGKQHLREALGTTDNTTTDTEYSESRKKMLQWREEYETLEGLLEDTLQCVQHLSVSLVSLVSHLDSMQRTSQPLESSVVESTSKEIQRQTSVFSRNISENPLRVTKGVLNSIEHVNQQHCCYKQARLDVDRIRHEVKGLKGVMPGGSGDKEKSYFMSRMEALDRVTARFRTLAEEGKKRMQVITSDASESVWNIFGIFFKQAHEHFAVVAGDMERLALAVGERVHPDYELPSHTLRKTATMPMEGQHDMQRLSSELAAVRRVSIDSRCSKDLCEPGSNHFDGNDVRVLELSLNSEPSGGRGRASTETSSSNALGSDAYPEHDTPGTRSESTPWHPDWVQCESPSNFLSPHQKLAAWEGNEDWEQF